MAMISWELRELMSLLEVTRMLVDDDALALADRRALADLLLSDWLPAIALDFVKSNYPTFGPTEPL
jgi:hypothetical protein